MSNKISAIFLFVFVFGLMFHLPTSNLEALAQEAGTLIFQESFVKSGSLSEAASIGKSSSPNWWLRTGGKVPVSGGIGTTLMGDLRANDPIAKRYALSYPATSDKGAHPQNFFRLFTKHEWADSDTRFSVQIRKDNLDNPANRLPWNGISLISRYQDDNNYYLSTIRMDGSAVIKKKAGGKYYTLNQRPFFPGTYNASTNPNLLPKNKWLGIRQEINTTTDGEVIIRFYVDENLDGNWRLAAEAIDNGQTNGALIGSRGLSGIFTDFMDVEFDNFQVRTSQNSPIVTPPESEPEPEPEPELPPASTGYGLDKNLTIEETGSSGAASNPYWWVNSGAYFFVNNGVGRTILGTLPAGDPWHDLYARNNPLDTDNGLRPQNIFRLVTKRTDLQNYTQEAAFRIRTYNQSQSPNRDAHNGFLFFNRYQDGNNLYYSGIRVDGKATIKKKQNGTYATLATATVFPGTYNRSNNPNLIPTDKWMGLRTTIVNNSDGSVTIRVYLDKEKNGNWTLVAQATDRNNPIRNGAAAGIRTDFMDAEFSDLKFTE